ncbi:MAG: endonuclease/exonuclease/phosphatase, partial [Actinomycetia bacterium]|nr:endonuclease/exonuclease/phosphatase [Actinomycetes bacterium]
IATVVDASTAQGTAITIVNTHLDEKSAERRSESLRQLLAWIADSLSSRPTILLGDFNCVLGAEELTCLESAGLGAVLGRGHGPTTNGFGQEIGRQIDHIFVSDHWEVGPAIVDRSAGLASDHFPVVADLSLR